MVCLPHVGGDTSGARGPLRNVRVRSSKGNCGASLKTVTIWAVFSSTSTLPGILTKTPRSSTSWRISSRAKVEPKGLSPWAARYIDPSADFGKSGECKVTSPILEASGHCTSSFVPSFICARVQDLSPSEKEGEKLIPSGSLTVKRLTGGVARALGFSFWATLTWTSRPVG